MRCGYACRLRSVAAAAAAACAALAGLVAAGSLGRIDQWAVRHAMPGATDLGNEPTLVESAVPLLHAGFHPPLKAVAQIVTLPGQVVVSLALLAAAGASLRRRGRTERAAVLAAAWFLATAIEVLCKEAIVRPALYRDGLHASGFDSSWPSGHAVRSTIVALAVAAAWPRARAVLALWLAAALVLLELGGFHTPSDVVGGLLLGVLVASGGLLVERSRALGRAAAPGARSAGARGAPRGS